MIVLSFSEHLFKLTGLLKPRDHLVLVRSWLPSWSGRYVCWPTLLVDSYPFGRCTISPCWDSFRFRDLWDRFNSGMPPDEYDRHQHKLYEAQRRFSVRGM